MILPLLLIYFSSESWILNRNSHDKPEFLKLLCKNKYIKMRWNRAQCLFILSLLHMIIQMGKQNNWCFPGYVSWCIFSFWPAHHIPARPLQLPLTWAVKWLWNTVFFCAKLFWMTFNCNLEGLEKGNRSRSEE